MTCAHVSGRECVSSLSDSERAENGAGFGMDTGQYAADDESTLLLAFRDSLVSD